MEDIRDFLRLHYITKKHTSQFWLDTKNLKIPSSLQQKLEIWRCRLPVQEDFIYNSDYCLFSSHNYVLLMQGLELLNCNSIKREFHKHNHELKDNCREIIDIINKSEQEYLITPKQALDIIRQS